MATNPASEPETVHSLLSDRNLRQCLSILRALQRFPDSRYFLRPVDPVADGAPDYYFVIQNPMDFQTIEQSLQARSYTLFGFNQDVMQVFTNCFTYNPPGTPVNAMGQRVKQYYVELAQSAFPEFIASLPGISFLDRRPKARHSTTSTSVTGSRNRSRSPSQSSRSPSVEGSDRESDNDAASERLSENADSQSRKRSRPSKPYPSSSSSAPSALPSDPNVSQPVSFPVISTKPVYAAPGSPTQQSNVPEGSPNEEEEDEDEEARKKIKHDGRVCEFCTATETPLWRAGPNGRNTLCNRCGVKWKAGRLIYKNGVYTVIAKGPMQPPRHAPIVKTKAHSGPKVEFDIPYGDKKKLQQAIALADDEGVRNAVDIIERGMSRFRQPVRYLRAEDEDGEGEEYEVDLEKVDGETLRELWEWAKYREGNVRI